MGFSVCFPKAEAQAQTPGTLKSLAPATILLSLNPASTNQHPSPRSLPPPQVLDLKYNNPSHERLKANTRIFFGQCRGKLWNAFPQDVRDAESLHGFKI